MSVTIAPTNSAIYAWGNIHFGLKVVVAGHICLQHGSLHLQIVVDCIIYAILK